MANHKRRINIAGGANISDACGMFCEQLGIELVRDPNIIIVTGGLKAFGNSSNTLSVDWATVKGALSSLQARQASPDEQIETVLPQLDSSKHSRFHEGKIITLPNGNLQARRFNMVTSVDMLVTIEGDWATEEMIDLAVILHKPVFPLPFTEGASRKKWHEHKAIILKTFGIEKTTAQDLESLTLKNLSSNSVSALTKQLQAYLQHPFENMVAFEKEMLIFLSYAREDATKVREVYTQLHHMGLHAWMDQEDLLAGQVWREEIPKVIRASDLAILFFSKTAVSKRGYIQKEFKLALDVLDEIPGEQIFIIPVRLDDCPVPERFRHLHYCDLFEESGFQKMMNSISEGLKLLKQTT